MKRKLFANLINWKNSVNKKPLIIYGARQVGKSYLVQKFARDNYEYLYEINFEFETDAKKLFDGNLTIGNLLLQLTAYKIDIPVIPGKTLLFFDEVQKCPQVLTALKSFAIDGRFDVIASGSMLGIALDNVSSYPVGYVDTLNMKPMDFEEFLWAKGYSEELIEKFKEYYEKEEMVPEGVHNKLNELFLHYVAVGGMPEVVKTYINTSDIRLVVEVQKKILDDYKNDLAHYATNDIKQKVKECYDAIPDQLAMENKKYQYKVLKEGGNARYYASSINWITSAGLAQKVCRLKTFDLPLRAYRDLQSFKLYFNDTGLLLAMYEGTPHYDIISGNASIFKGGIFENAIAQSLIQNNMPIYYYRRDDRLEIDFVTLIDNKIIPIEVKSGKNTKSISLNNILDKYNIDCGIKLSLNNVNCTNPKVKCFPLYMVIFIKNRNTI